MINFSAITPHPPILIPEIGSREDLTRISKTVTAMQRLSLEIKDRKIETILIISPHAPPDYDSFAINFKTKLKGSLSQFGIDRSFDFENNLELVRQISSATKKAGIPSSAIEAPLDHGSLVPLYYLTKDLKCQLISLSLSWLSLNAHFEYGKIIGEILRKSSKKIAVIGSGDLSHRLIPAAPAGYSKRGKEFDELLIKMLQENDISGILNLKEELVEEAGECGLRSIIMLLGILSQTKYSFNRLSYEGPFGVGYLVARLV